MPDDRERPTQPKPGSGWLIGFAALFVGYLLGQNSTPGSTPTSYAQATPASVAATPASAAGEPTGAELSPGTEATANAIDEAAAGELETIADETSATNDQPTYAYAPAPTDTERTDLEAGTTGAQVANSPEDTVTAAVDGGAPTVGATAPWKTYPPTRSASTYQAPPYSYTPPVASYSSTSSKCEGVGCYGVTSTVTGLPRTTYVRGYTRKDGTYVQPHYRSRRRN